MHAHNIIHLDLKPENVLLSADNVPWVRDFGLSTLALILALSLALTLSLTQTLGLTLALAIGLTPILTLTLTLTLTRHELRRPEHLVGSAWPCFYDPDWDPHAAVIPSAQLAFESEMGNPIPSTLTLTLSP